MISGCCSLEDWGGAGKGGQVETVLDQKDFDGKHDQCKTHHALLAHRAPHPAGHPQRGAGRVWGGDCVIAGVTIGVGVRAWVRRKEPSPHGSIRRGVPAKGNCRITDTRIDMDALHCAYSTKDPLQRDFYAEMCRVERWRTIGGSDPMPLTYKLSDLGDAMRLLRYGAVSAQLLRDMTVATTVGHINNRNILNLLIPFVSDAFHRQITNLVKQSIDKKQESKRLLDQVKTRVEQLVEEAVRI